MATFLRAGPPLGLVATIASEVHRRYYWRLDDPQRNKYLYVHDVAPKYTSTISQPTFEGPIANATAVASSMAQTPPDAILPIPFLLLLLFMLYIIAILACAYYLGYTKEQYSRCSIWSILESAGIGPIDVDEPVAATSNPFRAFKSEEANDSDSMLEDGTSSAPQNIDSELLVNNEVEPDREVRERNQQEENGGHELETGTDEHIARLTKTQGERSAEAPILSDACQAILEDAQDDHDEPLPEITDNNITEDDTTEDFELEHERSAELNKLSDAHQAQLDSTTDTHDREAKKIPANNEGVAELKEESSLAQAQGEPADTESSVRDMGSIPKKEEAVEVNGKLGLDQGPDSAFSSHDDHTKTHVTQESKDGVDTTEISAAPRKRHRRKAKTGGNDPERLVNVLDGLINRLTIRKKEPLTLVGDIDSGVLVNMLAGLRGNGGLYQDGLKQAEIVAGEKAEKGKAHGSTEANRQYTITQADMEEGFRRVAARVSSLDTPQQHPRQGGNFSPQAVNSNPQGSGFRPAPSMPRTPNTLSTPNTPIANGRPREINPNFRPAPEQYAETSRLVDLAGDNGPRMKDMEEEGEVEDEVEGEVGKAEVEEDAGGEKE